MTTTITPKEQRNLFFKKVFLLVRHDIELRAIDPKTKKVTSRFMHTLKDIEDFTSINLNKNLYFGVYSREGREGKKENVREVTCLFADMDFKGYKGGEAEAWGRLKGFPIEPTVIIHSGNGLHVYWFLDRAIEPSPQIEAILRGIAKELKSDKAVCECARIMRVPGTYNYKSTPRKNVLIIEINDTAYAPELFDKYREKETVFTKDRSNCNRELSDHIAEINEKCAFLKYCYENSATLPEPLWFSMISNLSRYHTKPISLVHAFSENYPGYTPKETDLKIRRCLDNGGPHTCEVIKQTMKDHIGPDCGKTCGVTSPLVLFTRKDYTQKKEESESFSQAIDNLKWIDPIPFDDYSLLPDFPIEVLPETGREMVKAASEVNQVDPGMTASIYLSVLSACVARKGIVNLISHQEPLNIYTCSILPSGNRKSSTMDIMTGPVYDYQKKQQESMQDTIRDALNAHRIREARLDRLQKAAAKADDSAEIKKLEMDAAEVAREISENPVPKAPLFIADDVTAEALGIHMAENNERMAVMSTEGGIFDIMAGRYSDKNGNLDLYLKAHSGDPWSSHRVGREAKTMQSLATTMCLTVQPPVIREIGSIKQFRGRGLLARFLYSLCKSQVGYRSRQIKAVSESITRAYQKHIEGLMDVPMTTNTLKLLQDAQELWDEFYNDIEADLREGGSLHYLADWGSKLPGAVARIAGLLHFAEHGARGVDLPISVNIVSASCVIGAYYKEHALATFGIMEADAGIEAAKKILDYLTRHSPVTFKGRDVLRHTNFKTMDEVTPGLKILIERGYIRETEIICSVVGRPEAMSYEVNPKIKIQRNH
jgi:Protein of unknown function (DUF3987)